MTERIPARLLRALPPEEAGCEHLAHQGTDELRKLLPVSYTHLTLPTKA